MSRGWHARGGSNTRWRELRAYVLRRDRALCRIGGRGCTEVATHVDHIIPRESGGQDTEGNLRAACEHCNLTRPRARPTEEPEPRRVSRW